MAEFLAWQRPALAMLATTAPASSRLQAELPITLRDGAGPDLVGTGDFLLTGPADVRAVAPAQIIGRRPHPGTFDAEATMMAHVELAAPDLPWRYSPVPYAAGPGTADALLGPTRRFPPSSIHAMAPPPEPIASTLIVGTLMGCWLMMVVELRTGSPPTTMPTRNVVPPASPVTTFLWPSCSANRAAPTTPPLSTDPTVVIADAGASSAEIVPPELCMMSNGPRRPRRSSSETRGRR